MCMCDASCHKQFYVSQSTKITKMYKFSFHCLMKTQQFYGFAYEHAFILLESIYKARTSKYVYLMRLILIYLCLISHRNRPSTSFSHLLASVLLTRELPLLQSQAPFPWSLSAVWLSLYLNRTQTVWSRNTFTVRCHSAGTLTTWLGTTPFSVSEECEKLNIY